MKKNKKKCGYILFVGQPNAGKSTLFNACVGTKLTGVSKKPQTTRNNIQGVLTEDKTQLIFVDTPGMHKGEKRTGLISRLMNQEAWSMVPDVDVLCFLVDITKGLDSKDQAIINELHKKADGKPFYILLTKRDKLKKQKVDEGMLAAQAALNQLNPEVKIIAFSAKQKDDIKKLVAILGPHLPEREWDFPEDVLSDKSERFILEELIREKLFRCLGQEIPYHTAVRVYKIESEEDRSSVHADIIVSKESYKPMVLGARGKKIKEIGEQARESLEDYFAHPVYLQLTVKVIANWQDTRESIYEIQGI